MAVEIKFLDAINPDEYIKVSKVKSSIRNYSKYIAVESVADDKSIAIWLDKPTAIKLKKQLGTLINQITLEEANNA